MALLTISLFLTISGSTVLNMWHDRDIDCQHEAHLLAALAHGKVTPREALILGWCFPSSGC